MRNCDFVKVEFRDSNFKLLLRGKFDLSNKKEVIKLISIIEKFSGVSLYDLISDDAWI